VFVTLYLVHIYAWLVYSHHSAAAAKALTEHLVLNPHAFLFISRLSARASSHHRKPKENPLIFTAGHEIGRTVST